MSFEHTTPESRSLTWLPPIHHNSAYPAIHYADLPMLYSSGLSALGVIAGIFNTQGRLLTLRHNASRKLPQDALGLLSETSQHYTSSDSTRTLETPPETLSRAFQEELSVDATRVPLIVRKTGAWSIHDKWPIGNEQSPKQALALVAIGSVSTETEDYIRDTFQPTEEIAGIDFTDPHELSLSSKLRAGTSAILKIALSRRSPGSNDQTILHLPPAMARPDAHDAVYIPNSISQGVAA